MTVLDEVLQTEKAAATKVAEATVAAVEQVTVAKTTHAEAVEAEKVRLAVVEASELAEYTKTVQTNSEVILSKAANDAADIATAFSSQQSVLERKINEAIS